MVEFLRLCDLVCDFLNCVQLLKCAWLKSSQVLVRALGSTWYLLPINAKRAHIFCCFAHMQINLTSAIHNKLNAFIAYVPIITLYHFSPPLQVSVYRHGEKIPEAKPTFTPKTIIPPKLPIEMPQPKIQPAAPSTPSPAPSKTAAGRGVKSPTPSRRK